VPSPGGQRPHDHLEDVAALLFWWAVTDEELADDSYVRLLVAETVINLGSGQIEELRCQLGRRLDQGGPPSGAPGAADRHRSQV
jgi:hypothetical protein